MQLQKINFKNLYGFAKKTNLTIKIEPFRSNVPNLGCEIV